MNESWFTTNHKALTPLAKIILIPLDLKAAASAANEAIQIKIYGLHMTTLII